MTYSPAFGGVTEIVTGYSSDIGFIDYNDTATSLLPLSVTAILGEIALTNDGLGIFSNSLYKPTGITDIWDSVSNKFDWTDLSLGDMVDIRLEIEVTTTSPNQYVEVNLYMNEGISEYSIPFVHQVYKSAGTYKISAFNGIYMGNTDALNNPAVFRILSDDDASVVVNGWYCKIIKKG